MASPRWRMNGLWRRMAGALLLCALLLSTEVTCQDDDPAAAADPTDAPADAGASTDAVDAAASPAAPGATEAPAAAADPIVTTASAADGFPATIVNIDISRTLDDGSSGASVPTAASNAEDSVPDKTAGKVEIVPEVTCVGSNDIADDLALKVEAATDDCEETKRLIKENLGGDVCGDSQCGVKLYQNDKTVLVASDNVKLQTLARALRSDPFKGKLTVAEPEPAASSGSSVFVGILVSGLLAALGITLGYFKCQRRSDGKGVRLAEEPFPVDQENQGNTLVSVAPLNPPPEPQDKPSVNGESPEAAKTQPPPPTNGHSTTKTADTEL